MVFSKVTFDIEMMMIMMVTMMMIAFGNLCVIEKLFLRFSGNPVEQRMMVNYYQVWNISQEFKEDQKENVSIVIDFQKMRERNNEASKRCRLKRRIKQVMNRGLFINNVIT